MKIERVDLMRSYRFGPKTNGVVDFTRFIVGERGVESIHRDELGWVWIAGCGETLVVPPQHVDYCRPATSEPAHAVAGFEVEGGPPYPESLSDRAKRAWETRRANAKAKE